MISNSLSIFFGFFHSSFFRLFLFFAPALLFDTTRYFLTNLLYSIFSLFATNHKKQFPFTYYPLVSVIIPVYNEKESFYLSLQSILENNYPNFEIIVVDDGNSSFIWQVCRKLQKEKKLLYLKKEIRGGKPSSLNYGLKFAKGEFVIHLDGDSTLSRNAILEVIQCFSDSKVGAVSGNLKVLNQNKNLLTRLQSAEYEINIGMQRRWLSWSDTLQITSGAFSCFRKELLLALHGTDPDEGEDLDITLKIRKMGYKIAFAHRAIAYTSVPDSWAVLFKQRFRWDRCYIRLNLRKHGNLINLSRFRLGDFIAIVSDFFFNLIPLLALPIYLLAVLSFFPEDIFSILVFTFSFYAILNLLQFLLVIFHGEKSDRKPRNILYTPLFLPYNGYLRTISALAYFREFFSKKTAIRNSHFPENFWENLPRY